MDAVGRDQHVGALRRQAPAGGAVEELRGDAALVLLEGDEMAPGADALGAERRARRVLQDHQQIAAVDRILRPGIAGGAAARLAPDELPVPVVVGERRGLDRGVGERPAEAQLDQLAHRVGLKIDPEPERIDARDRFEDAALDPRRRQAERRREPADAAADDQRLHAESPGPAARSRH